MKVSFLKTLLAAATIAAAGVANASPLGYTDWSAGLGSNASWALWDVFPSGGMGAFGPTAASFSGRSADAGTSGAALNGSFIGGGPGALLLPDGPGNANSLIYTGGASITFSLEAVTTTTLDTFVLQIKQNGKNGEVMDSSGLTSYFSPKINGVAFSNSIVGTAFADPISAETSDWVITTWTWSGLGLGSGDAFNLTFSGNFSHKAIDGIRIDSNGQLLAVPEPSTYALIGLGLGAVLWSFRRRSTQVSA